MGSPATIPAGADQICSHQPLRVLIVEDNSADAELTVAVLKRAGYPLAYDIVDSPKGLAESLAKFTYDLILSDHNLITWTGMDALQTVKRLGKDTPFVLVSAVLGDEAAVEYIKQGATDYVLKHRLDRLPIVVNRALQERAHREEEARLQETILVAKKEWELTFDAVPDMVMILDEGCRIQRANRAVAQFANRKFSQIIGKPCYEVLLGASESPPTCPHQRMLESSREETGEFTDPQSGRTFEATVSPIRKRSPSAAGCVCVMRDVTERKRYEKEIAFTNAFLLTQQETAPDGILVVDEYRKIVSFNQRFVDMWEIPPDVVTSRSDEQAVQSILGKLAAPRGFLQKLDYLYEHPAEKTQDEISLRDGRTFDRIAAPMVGRDGTRYGRIFFFRDMTERKRMEEALRQGEERYRDLLEYANDAIYTTDLVGNFTSINRMAEQLTGRSREEALQMNIGQILAPEFVETGHQEIERLLQGGTPGIIEVDVLAKDGHRVALETNNRILLEKGEPIGIQGIARDISGRKKLEAQLTQVQKMEATARLAGGVAHDFNNLLGVILGYSELLLEQLSRTSSQYRQIEQIKQAADRGASLTRQLLAFSRKQVLESRVLDLNAVVDESERLVRRLIGEDIEFKTILAPALGHVKADPVQIDQVIMNLAINSRDAMPQGGKLTIETANVELDERYAQTHAEVRQGRYAMIAVSDTGVGMSREVQRHLFEPFFTTKPLGKGTGLGLSTVYGIVRQSNGHISVYSEPDKGTTFKVYLPEVEEPLAVVEIPLAARAQGGTETILLVEDEASLRDVTREFLQQKGYEVLEAIDGAAAIQVAKTHSGPIDLLLTDMVMPGMNGRQLAMALAPSRPSMRVVYMSGYTSNAIANVDGMESGINFIGKPFTQQALLGKLRDVLEAAGCGQIREAS